MQKIPIRGTDKVALVDESDFELVSKYNWCLHSGGYVQSSGNAKHVRTYLHRLLLSPEAGQQVDHINRDKLDNRRENLRVVSARVNMLNRDTKQNASCKYIGVHFAKTQNKFIAQVKKTLFSRAMHIGTYNTAEEAALKYDMYMKRVFGETKQLNFNLSLI